MLYQKKIVKIEILKIFSNGGSTLVIIEIWRHYNFNLLPRIFVINKQWKKKIKEKIKRE